NAVIREALRAGPLAEGTSSDAARWTKRLLKIAGFNPSEGNAFDARTASELRAFQTAEGLPATGELDEATFGKLEKVQEHVRTGKDSFIVGQRDKSVSKAEKELKL